MFGAFRMIATMCWGLVLVPMISSLGCVRRATRTATHLAALRQLGRNNRARLLRQFGVPLGRVAGHPRPLYAAFARLLASAGINAISLPNVNACFDASLLLLSSDFVQKAAALETAFA